MATDAGLPVLRDVPGWYGKLAGLGDFAHRRVSADWLRACDGWLSGVMRGAREELGPRWLDVYLHAPVLRFAWTPGLVERQWTFGVLMPSCDSVGRYFPLVIAQARGLPPRDASALDHLERWYAHVAQAALQTLDGADDPVEELEAGLREAPPWPALPGGRTLEARPVADAVVHALGQGEPLSHWMQALAARELALELAGCTLWWRIGAAGTPDSLAVVRGLPDASTFAALLAGEAAAPVALTPP